MTKLYNAKKAYQGTNAFTYELERQQNWFRRMIWNMEIITVRRILRRLPANMFILDIPCGTSRFLPLLSSYGHGVFSSDISFDMISQTPHERFSMLFKGFMISDAENLALRENSVDCVFSVRFFGHLPTAIKCQVLLEFARITRKYVVVSVPFLDSFTHARMFLSSLRRNSRVSLTVNRYPITKIEFKRLVEDVGMKIVQVTRVVPGSRVCFCLLKLI